MKTNIFKSLLGLVFVLTIRALPAQPIDAFTVPTTNGWTLYGSKSFIVGYDFTPAANIQITALGILDWTRSGLSNPSQVGIWDNTGALVASAIVPAGTNGALSAGASGAVFYVSNLSPVTLAAGRTYRIGNQMFGTGQPVVGWGGTFAAAPDITFGKGWGNNGSAFAEPVQFTNSTPFMGPVFKYLFPPAITTQPQNEAVLSGSNATFSVGADGQSPLLYQWYFNGNQLFDGGRISGSTNNVLTIANVQASDAGAYLVTVTNGAGWVSSSNAALTVLGPPQITAQPSDETVTLPTNAVFAVNVTGTGPVGYQWYFNGAPLTDGARVSGSSTPFLNISDLETNDAGAYQVLVTNIYGATTSRVATLTIFIPPQILMQPASESVPAGSNATFSAGAIGTDILISP